MIKRIIYRCSAFGAAVLVALFFIMPITAYADIINVCPPMNQWENGQINTSGNIDTTGTYKWKTSPFISVLADTTYTFTVSNADDKFSAKVIKYDSSMNYLSQTALSGTTMLYTNTPGVSYVRLCVRARSYDAIDNMECTFTYDGIVPPPSINGIEQIVDEVHYGTDGDFVYYSDNLQKHLMFYKYLPDDKEDIKYIRVEAVNNYGQRLKFRIVGFNNGNEVFRSGLADYGENIDIQNCNFTYYDVYLVNMDDENQVVNTESVATFRYIYGYKTIVPFPTDPPGTPEDVVVTDYVDLNSLDWYIPSAPAPDSSARGALELITSVNNRLFSAFPIYVTAGGVAFLCWLLWLSVRRSD